MVGRLRIGGSSKFTRKADWVAFAFLFRLGIVGARLSCGGGFYF
jgi:hypothetical protein